MCLIRDGVKRKRTDKMVPVFLGVVCVLGKWAVEGCWGQAQQQGTRPWEGERG
jgi:hypothetical protein